MEVYKMINYSFICIIRGRYRIHSIILLVFAMYMYVYICCLGQTLH